MKKVRVINIFLVLIVSLLINSSVYAKYVIDKNIIAANLDIDRTKPYGIVNYSTESMSSEKILITVILSEPIQEVKGWNLSEDKLTLTKIYSESTTDIIKVTDLSGNESTIKICINVYP